MEPVLHTGDRVLTFNWVRRIMIGDVIVFKRGNKNYLKRVQKIRENLVYVSGDNRLQSAKMGPVEPEQIIGKVILKY